MKNVKLISLVLSMLISFVSKAQEKTPANKKVNGSAKIEMVPKTFTKSKDTISDVKVSLNFVQSSPPANRITICVPSQSVLKEPLYILDGVLINSKQLSKINPNDIEEIKVLKGTEATALYGNKAINGVVVITTKEKE
nr:TonB-dependent receptor plug domain-containing protein [uncultured Flavobacterium sp.]